ncbi:SAG family member [Eimeria brunetti]|uniref:SAG family member n=1 Tax=Eimeria brunetti TaxID=51314 RepID=U6L634_9EIME|nr:SAG family member [Eimeria brunetti]
MDSRSYAYLSVNLARNGKLPVHINEVEKDGELVTSLESAVADTEGSGETTCKKLLESKETLKHVFYQIMDPQQKPDYRQLLQTSLNEGLGAFTKKEYPKTEDEWQAIWGNEAGANLAYLLSANSTTVGCIVGKCTAEQTEPIGPTKRDTEAELKTAVLFCQLAPEATKNQAPFDEEYFTGLIARTAQLADMTADDLKATNGSAAAAAVPTIVFAGLVAMLAVVSA